MSNISSYAGLKPKLVGMVAKLEDALGAKNLWITSGLRSKAYNEKIGGAENSEHLTGSAVDIARASFKQSPEEFRRIAESLGFGGIGLYDTHVHVDIGPPNRRWDNRTGSGVFDVTVPNNQIESAEAIVESMDADQVTKLAISAVAIGLAFGTIKKIID